MLINPYVFGGYTVTDVDAASYISAVEAADGAALESGVKQAIDNFVIGCKADGIWTAIKASCILAGARTLSGALVPLVGTAPTNNNFASGDYNRKTGLIGDGSSKYLDTNRSSTADPQDNTHLSVYQSTAASSAADTFMTHIGAVDANVYVSHIAEGLLASGNLKLRRLRSPSSIGVVAMTSTNNANGLQGVARAASSAFVFRAGATDTTITSTSVAQSSVDYSVLAQNNAGTVVNYSNARLAFYSIGEFLYLDLLDSRVTTLINALAAAIP